MLVVDPRRRRHDVHLVAERAGLDVHRLLDAGHPIDHERVRPGHVHHDGCVDLLARVERDPLHAVTAPPDLDDPHIEQEPAALRLGRQLQIPGGELRVVHVAGTARVDRPLELLVRLAPEVRSLRPAGRPELVDVVVGDPALQRVRVPLLMVHAQVPEVLQDLLVMAGLALEEHGAALHVLRDLVLVRVDLEVVGPVLPVGEALRGPWRRRPRTSSEHERSNTSCWSGRTPQRGACRC